MNAYEVVKAGRKSGSLKVEQLEAAVEETREAVRKAAVSFAEIRGNAYATEKLTPFPVDPKEVAEAAAELDRALRRLSKATFWLARATNS